MNSNTMNDDFLTFIALTHGSLHTDPEYFIRSLPDEVADKVFYRQNRNVASIDLRRDIAIRYCKSYNETKHLDEVFNLILPALEEYYRKK